MGSILTGLLIGCVRLFVPYFPSIIKGAVSAIPTIMGYFKDKKTQENQKQIAIEQAKIDANKELELAKINITQEQIDLQKQSVDLQKQQNELKKQEVAEQQNWVDKASQADSQLNNANNSLIIDWANFFRALQRPYVVFILLNTYCLSAIVIIIVMIVVNQNIAMAVFSSMEMFVSTMISYLFLDRVLVGCDKKNKSSPAQDDNTQQNNQKSGNKLNPGQNNKSSFDVNKAFEFIKPFEGCSSLTPFNKRNNTIYRGDNDNQVLYAYKCTAGVWTIGFGDTISCKYQKDDVLAEGTFNITYKVAVKTCKGLITEFYNAIYNKLDKTVASKLTANQWSAMLCLAYQQGVNGFVASNTFKCINTGDISGIKQNWADGWEEFEKRRQQELELFFK